MNNLEQYVQGTCLHMCPEDEIKFRESHGLLHRLEMLAGTEIQNKPKADRSRTVKAFCRSAAGVKLNVAKNLRPAHVLRETVAYLLHDIVTVSYLPWNVVYDFVMDRLRAVRQDMVIQNLTAAESISLLQPIIRFYAFAAYRLCEENRDVFDQVINKKHLEECLKRLLMLYDECEDLHDRYASTTLNSTNVNLNQYSELYAVDRPYFEAIYILLNLGDGSALTRALELPKRWRKSALVKLSFAISRLYYLGNWVQTCKLIVHLPPLHCAVASLHLPKLRRRALKVMSVSYSSRNLKFPAMHLKDLLVYDSLDHLYSDCRYFGIECDEKEEVIHFLKGCFNDKKEAFSKRQRFVDKKLSQCPLPSLLLENTL